MPIKTILHQLHNFFFESRDLRILGILRICYSIFLFINIALLSPDMFLFFGEEGLVNAAAGRSVIDPDVISLFDFLPLSNATVAVLFGALLLQTLLLGLGFYARFQAICIFVIIASLHHRNLMIFDGEDVVFRLFAFFLALSPSDHYYSMKTWFAQKRGDSLRQHFPIWPLRLFQIEMTMIYLSTSIEKLGGSEWINGTALYYVYRLEEFIRFPIPEFLHTDPLAIRIMTWSALGTEVLLPFLLWIKETRWLAIAMGFALHLGIEYQMNLNMFQWIMMTGLLAFVPLGEGKNYKV